jgi:hypothetical protein
VINITTDHVHLDGVFLGNDSLDALDPSPAAKTVHSDTDFLKECIWCNAISSFWLNREPLLVNPRGRTHDTACVNNKSSSSDDLSVLIGHQISQIPWPNLRPRLRLCYASFSPISCNGLGTSTLSVKPLRRCTWTSYDDNLGK